MQAVLAFSSGDFVLLFPLPAPPSFAPALGAALGFAGAALTSGCFELMLFGWTAGAAKGFAFGWVAFLEERKDCSTDRAFASSLSSTKNSWSWVHKKSKLRFSENSDDLLTSSMTLSKRLTVRSLLNKNSPSILWLGHSSWGIWFNTFMTWDEKSWRSEMEYPCNSIAKTDCEVIKEPRKRSKSKCREIMWAIARPLGAEPFRVQFSTYPWTLNCSSGTCFKPLINSAANHRSNLGTKPEDCMHSSAESTLNATLNQEGR